MSAATQEKQQEQVKEIIVLWKNQSKDGKTTYFSGKTRTGVSVVAFYNTMKKNPKEPDLRIYVKDEEGKTGEEIASLWCNVSEKTSKKYLTGKMKNQDIDLRGFFSNNEGNKPYIHIYLKTELDSYNETKKQAESKQVEEKKESKKETKPKKETPLF